MKKYKLIKNINQKNENISYFDRLSNKRVKEIANTENFILLSFDIFIEKYIPIINNINIEQKKYFNNNIAKYCYN